MLFIRFSPLALMLFPIKDPKRPLNMNARNVTNKLYSGWRCLLLFLFCFAFIRQSAAKEHDNNTELSPPLALEDSLLWADSTVYAVQSFRKSWIKTTSHRYIKVTSIDSLRGDKLYYTLKNRCDSISVAYIAELKIFHGYRIGRGFLIGGAAGLADAGATVLFISMFGSLNAPVVAAVLMFGIVVGGSIGILVAALFPHHYKFKLKQLSPAQKLNGIAGVLSLKTIRPPTRKKQ